MHPSKDTQRIILAFGMLYLVSDFILSTLAYKLLTTVAAQEIAGGHMRCSEGWGWCKLRRGHPGWCEVDGGPEDPRNTPQWRVQDGQSDVDTPQGTVSNERANEANRT